MNTFGTSGAPLSSCHSNQISQNGLISTTYESVVSRLHPPDCLAALARPGEPLSFDPLRNSYNVSDCLCWEHILDEIYSLTFEKSISFLHGYPSMIAEFASHVVSSHPKLLDVLRTTLRGVLLGSEYPARAYRDTISNAFDVPSVSWYGHTERSILAAELILVRHRPYHTHGYAEAVHDEISGDCKLRLLHLPIMPRHSFVTILRLIGSVVKSGFARPFCIASGRVDYVVDAEGNRLSLTAICLGGIIVYLILRLTFNLLTLKKANCCFDHPLPSTTLSLETCASLFDSSNLNFRIFFKIIDCLLGHPE